KLTADQEISLEGLNHSITILTSTIELLLAQAHETNDALARGRIVAQYVKECVSEIDALEQDFRDQPLALEGINIFNEQYSFDQFKDVFRRMLSNEVYRQALNLDSLLGGIVNQVNFGSHNVKIIKEWQPVSRWDYSGDDIHLTMAFLNLVVNSIESMDAVTGRDRVLTIKADISADGNAAIIKISDTGKGISADKLPLIGQLGNTFGKENGNGIGVYSARTIVEAHGGQLGIESVEGQGTTFTVTLPRLAQDSAQSAFQQIVDESGGVNFTPEKMNLQTQGAGAISFDFDPAQLARFESAPGVVPVIIGVRPAVDLPSFLGLSNAGAAGSGA
ncbi:MAG: GHKL domain-containing protein, partial [Candidatus Omnitrophica bacterium]|nr:GHKL domain-containing protein [Candidatus Omnitrophota bacterium]